MTKPDQEALLPLPSHIGKIIGRRLTPENTNEFWGYFVVLYRDTENERVYTADQMREYALACIDALSQHAGEQELQSALRAAPVQAEPIPGFAEMAERGAEAWAGTPANWLEDLRGNDVDDQVDMSTPATCTENVSTKRENANMTQAAQSEPLSYLSGCKDGLSHAARYVLDHCQQGEEHARVIGNIKLPDASHVMQRIEWIDQWDCKESISIEGAAEIVKEFFDEWPGGLDEIESSIRSLRERFESNAAQQLNNDAAESLARQFLNKMAAQHNQRDALGDDEKAELISIIRALFAVGGNEGGGK